MTESRTPRDRVVAAIDRLNETVGRVVPWLLVALVAIGAFNAIARYAGRSLGLDLSSNVYLELQWYLFSAVFLLGGAYTLKHRAHVRVDVLYDRLPARARGWIDRVGLLVLLIPFSIFMLVVSWDPVSHSISLAEQSPDPGGLPRYIVKPLVPLGFALLLLQGVAEALRRRDVDEPTAEDRSEAHL